MVFGWSGKAGHSVLDRHRPRGATPRRSSDSLRTRLSAVGLGLLLAWVGLSPLTALAQGTLIIVDHPVPLPRPIIVPRPQPSPQYALKELAIQARLRGQLAQVQLTQTFVNTGSIPIEAQFVFPLPYDGAIDQLTLLVDGKEFPAKLLTKEEARARYEAIVRSNRDPALLEWIGTGMFQTSVFPVPPGAERKVVLTYDQLLRNSGGLIDVLFPLSTAKYTAKPIEKLEIRVSITGDAAIQNVYSPSHAVNIQRSSPTTADVSFTATQQVPAADFRLFYDVGSGPFTAKVIAYRPKATEDGYFLMLASPPAVPAVDRPRKTLVFVVDKSGSMSGKKIEQAKSALKFVLNNTLRDGDLFNIVAYEGRVESFRPELERYSEETRKAALGYVEGLYSGGGTNIHDSLRTALGMLKDSAQPSYVLFLTDGLPTVGETNESKIVAAAREANAVRARILPFGVGYDVNSRLLDRVATENFGLSDYVRPEEDIEASVGRVSGRITAPVLSFVTVEYGFDTTPPENGPAINRQYPAQIHDIFAREQLVIVGRYKSTGVAKVTVSGKHGNESRKFDFPAEFVAQSPDASNAFVEKLWAARRIGEIINLIDLQGRNEELVKELVQLSTQHGIITPYTAFLADETAQTRSLAVRDNLSRAGRELEQLEASSGKAGVAQRSEKLAFSNAARAPVVASGPAGGVAVRDVNEDRAVIRRGLRQTAGETVYAKQYSDGGAQKTLLVAANAAELDPAKDQAKIQSVERFSDAYFALVKSNTADENRLLAMQQDGEDLLVVFRGQAYLVK